MTVESILNHSGKKYLRPIKSATRPVCSVEVDVYSVIDAFQVTCPARQQALKKILFAGCRGGKSEVQDLKEAIDALNRAVEMQEARESDYKNGLAVRHYEIRILSVPKLQDIPQPGDVYDPMQKVAPVTHPAGSSELTKEQSDKIEKKRKKPKKKNKGDRKRGGQGIYP